MTDDICFVCHNACFTASPCKCKSLMLHEQCRKKMVSFGFKRCPICESSLMRKQTELLMVVVCILYFIVNAKPRQETRYP